VALKEMLDFWECWSRVPPMGKHETSKNYSQTLLLERRR
jgi:hypothetical protein